PLPAQIESCHCFSLCPIAAFRRRIRPYFTPRRTVTPSGTIAGDRLSGGHQPLSGEQCAFVGDHFGAELREQFAQDRPHEGR
ncbi:MAG TPA: hypothetical protein VJ652_22340, partial [Noviherbaspirillum sp.]|nr:hypothetical protein [Noviherbaspirillum sp.]